MKKILLATLVLSALSFPSFASEKLEAVYTANEVWNGVTTSTDGRVFVSFPHLDGSRGTRIGEIKPDNTILPYPDAAWNDWQEGQDTESKFVRVNALRIGPDGLLWVVDTGAPKIGADIKDQNAAKLVAIDLSTNQVVKTLPLNSVTYKNSFIDDIRIKDNIIYMTDAGAAGLVIMDQNTGFGRRLLENHASTLATMPVVAEGKVMHYNGAALKINADQLEISPDGKWLYFQPVSGPLSRIEIKYLNFNIDEKDIKAHVEAFFSPPSTGGTAIDADGNIYIADVDKKQILKVSPQGKSEVILQDDRLIWADAMWIDAQGYLWIPSGQINRMNIFQDGENKIDWPVTIYKYQIKAKPFKS